MGNQQSITQTKNNGEIYFIPWVQSDVDDIWKKEKELENDTKSRRRRYFCNKKYVDDSVFEPWDIQINRALDMNKYTIVEQLKEEALNERKQELVYQRKMQYVERVYQRLNELCEPDQTFEHCKPYIKNITSDTIIAVLPLVRYNVERVSQYLLGELAEELKLTKFEEKLRDFYNSMSKDDKIIYPWPNANQRGSLLHYEDRTFDEAIHTYANMCEAIRQIYNHTKKTLNYNDAYALLRSSSWKVDTAVASHIQFLKSYRMMKRAISKICHDGDYTEIDYEFCRSILRRANCNTEEAIDYYCREYKKRMEKTENFKQDLIMRGYKYFPSKRAMYYHLADNFWDFDVSRDRWDYESLVDFDKQYTLYRDEQKRRILECKSQKNISTKTTTSTTSENISPLELSPIATSFEDNITTTNEASYKAIKSNETNEPTNEMRENDSNIQEQITSSPLSTVSLKQDKSATYEFNNSPITDNLTRTECLTIVVENDESPSSCISLESQKIDNIKEQEIYDEIIEEEIDELLGLSILHKDEWDDTTSTLLMIQQEKYRQELQQLHNNDSRNRDISITPKDRPCEANTEINKLVTQYNGDIQYLEVDVIVNPISEDLQLSEFNKIIFSSAGEHIQQEFATINKQNLLPGLCSITRGYRLPSKVIIHTIIPKQYKPKVLQTCVENILAMFKKYEYKTIAIPPLTKAFTDYPLYHGLHILSYYTRLWLDVTTNRRAIDRIVFCSTNRTEFIGFNRILPLYFCGPQFDTSILSERYEFYRKESEHVIYSKEFQQQLDSLNEDDIVIKEEEDTYKQSTYIVDTDDFDSNQRDNIENISNNEPTQFQLARSLFGFSQY